MADNDIARQIENILLTEQKAMEREIKAITKRKARELRDKIIADSPVDTTSVGEKVHGVYKNGWRVSTAEGIGYIDCTVRQYRRPSLTWLLENGHDFVNGKTAKAIPHIENNADFVTEQWIEELKRIDL